jgi:hypothetical protein
MTTMTVAPPSKLPLWRTIGQAYAVWARNFPDLIRTVWVWMLLIAPVMAIFLWWQEPRLMEMTQAARAHEPFTDPNPLLTLVMQILGQVIVLPALASVAVAWHRLLLRGEHPGPGLYLRLDSVVAGYAILAFWIAVITLGPGYVSRMFQIITGISATTAGVAALVVQSLAGVASIIAFFIVARLSLALPGIALGRDDVTLGTAWRISKRNTWRMFWAYFLCILPWGAISGGILYWVFLPDQGRAGVTLVSVVMGLLWIPVGMISVGMLSLAYRHFFERST